MKRGYKRLLIFQIIISIFFSLSSLVPSVLGDYYQSIIMLLLLILFKLLFGFEKDHHRDTRSIIIELFICLLIYYLLYYLLGIIISFVKTPNYLNIDNILKNILPIIITIVLKEILRYMMLKKSEGSILLIICSCLFFILFDITTTYNISIFNSKYTLFIYLAKTVLPIISRNIFLSYVSFKTGYKPAIFYLLVTNLYKYFVPIIPNPNQYIYSIIELVLPAFCLYAVYKYFHREKDEMISREYHQKQIGSLILPSIFVIFLVYITSGYFYYQAIVIATGSMNPLIKVGDIVIIEKIKNKKDIELGTIIAYNYEKRIIVHRLIKKINLDDDVYYYTKGDANNHIDNYKITEDMVIGIVNTRIPYLGYPTIWLYELS